MSLDGCNTHIYRGLHIKRTTRAQIVDETVQRLFLLSLCNISSVLANLVHVSPGF